MPRAKDRPILFEVIDLKSPPRTGPAVPPRAAQPPVGQAVSPPPPRTPSHPTARAHAPAAASAPAAPRYSAATELDASASDSPAAGPSPLFRFKVAGREVALTWVGLTGVAAGIVFFSVVVYQIGTRLSGGGPPNPAKGADPIAVALNKPADPTPLNVPASQKRNGGRIAQPPSAPEAALASDVQPAAGAAAESRPAPDAEAAGGMERKKGCHYVVVQHFQKSRAADAQAAATFLRSNGIACGVVSSNADVRLIASESFLIDQQDKNAATAEQARCNELKRRIRELGKQYARTGRYAFEQCYQDKN